MFSDDLAPGPAGPVEDVSERAAERTVRAMGVSASLSLLLGTAGLGAWMAGLAQAWAIRGAITMKTNMAFALVAASVALLLLRRPGAPSSRRRLAVLLAAIVSAVGALTLSQHLFGIDLGIDQILASEPPGAPATASPNRMGPIGAVSLTLVGGGLLALGWRRARGAFVAGAAVCALTTVPAVGWLLGVREFYSVPTLTGIAWPTVVACLALGAALMLSHHRGGPVSLLLRNDPGGRLFRQMMPVALLAPVLVGLLTSFGEWRGALDPQGARGAPVVGLTILLSALLYLSAADLSRAAARRAQGDRQLQQSETRLRLAQSSGHVGVWELDRASGAVKCTPELAALYGLVPAELSRYEHWRQRVHPDDIERVERAIKEALGRGDRFDVEFRIRHASGATRWILARGQQMSDPQGGVSRVLGVNVDVTDHRLAVEALRQAHDQLLELDRRKDEYLAVLSHELRNPLAPITNSLYVLERAEPGSDVHHRALGIATRQVAQLSRLVGDLLDATRLSRGKVVLQRRPIDLNELVAHSVEDHRALLVEAGVSLDLCRAASPVPVHADWNRISQALGNLLHNAAKFTRRGDAVTVTVGSEPATGRAEIRVTDTGLGLSDEVLARLFEPFAQASATLDRSRGGLGLGLALVKGLVELHGGEVQASSAGEGRGSTFLIRLPLAVATAEPPRATTGASLPRRRVLIVEDKADAAASLRDRLELDGHEVATTTNGAEALARAATMRPDVVLCDIGLPGLDGYGVARAMRADPSLSRTLLVALTGYALSTDRARALAAGFDGHLAKPLDHEVLNGILRDLRMSESTTGPPS